MGPYFFNQNIKEDNMDKAKELANKYNFKIVELDK